METDQERKQLIIQELRTLGCERQDLEEWDIEDLEKYLALYD